MLAMLVAPVVAEGCSSKACSQDSDCSIGEACLYWVGSCSARGTCMTFPDPAASGGCGSPAVQCGDSYTVCGCGVTAMSGCKYPAGYASGPTNGDRDCLSPGSTGGPGPDGGDDATGPEAGDANPDAGAGDGAAPDTASEAAAPSCPATYADVPQFSPCSGYVSCNYFGQFNCACVNGGGNALEWECISYNCICSSDDAGCVNQPCTGDADCPSGQHCSQALGSMGLVCSVGCEGDAGAGGPEASCPVGAMCESIAP
jgi:hypothetical protein